MPKPTNSISRKITLSAASLCALYLAQPSPAASVRGWGSQFVDSTQPGRKDFIAISAGGGHTIALRADGSIVG